MESDLNFYENNWELFTNPNLDYAMEWIDIEDSTFGSQSAAGLTNIRNPRILSEQNEPAVNKRYKKRYGISPSGVTANLGTGQRKQSSMRKHSYNH